MSHYKPYPAYKDSGVAWIGMVPADWEVKPIGRVASCNDDSLPENVQPDQVLRYVDISSVNHTDGITDVAELRFADAPSRARRRAKTGDVVISTVRTYLKAVATVTGTHADCIYSTGFAVLRARPSEVEPEFLKWMTLNDLVIQAIEARSEGLSYPAINATELVKLKAVIPPPAEQTAIAAALDRETARIDALIAKKTRFIELLKEKRQALITHAVTKGLSGLRHSHESGNPESPATGPKALDSRMRGNDEGGRASGDDSMAVPMKDSGVEWIGEVPEHWTVCKLNFRYSIELGKMLDQKRITGEHLVPYLRNQDVQWGEISAVDLPLMDISPDEFERYTAVDGDLLVCEGGDVGRAAIWRGAPIGYQKALHRLRPRGGDHTPFMYNLLIAAKARGVFSESDSKSTISHLPAEAFRTYRFPFPPSVEQQRITTALDRETARIDALIAKVERSITLLKERRSALITAAVTGQVDLRSPRHSRVGGNPELREPRPTFLDSRLRGNDGRNDGGNGDRSDDEACKP